MNKTSKQRLIRKWNRKRLVQWLRVIIGSFSAVMIVAGIGMIFSGYQYDRTRGDPGARAFESITYVREPRTADGFLTTFMGIFFLAMVIWPEAGEERKD